MTTSDPSRAPALGAANAYSLPYRAKTFRWKYGRGVVGCLVRTRRIVFDGEFPAKRRRWLPSWS